MKKRKPTKTVTRPPTIPASDLLRAEATRLKVLSHVVPDDGAGMMEAMVWAFNMAAAYLDSLGAPEKLVRYVRADKPQ